MKNLLGKYSSALFFLGGLLIAFAFGQAPVQEKLSHYAALSKGALSSMFPESGPSGNPAMVIPLNRKEISAPAAKKQISANSGKDISFAASIAGSGAPKNNVPVVVASSGPAEATSSSAETASVSEAIADCEFGINASSSHKILINEIAWMGTANGATREWMELKNASGETTSLKNWTLMSEDGGLDIKIAEQKIFPTGEIWVLERGNDTTLPNIKADVIYTGTLSNGGEWLRLFDAGCNLVDEVDARAGWPAGNSSAKRTMERKVGNLGWQTSDAVGGTPRVQNYVLLSSSFHPELIPPTPDHNSPVTNSAPLANPTSTSDSSSTLPAPVSPPAAGINHLLIAEVQTVGNSGVTNEDYIKIFNPTSAGADISGWKLRKRTKTGTEDSVRVFPAGAAIASAGYFTWANSANGFAASVNANESSTQTLASDNSIALLDASGAVIDAVAWGATQNAFIEGSVFGTNPAAGQILKRKIASGAMQDTDNNSADFGL